MTDEIDSPSSSELNNEIRSASKLKNKKSSIFSQKPGLFRKVTTFIGGLGVIIAAILGGYQIIQEIVKSNQIKKEITIQLSVGDRFFEQFEYERAIEEYEKILKLDYDNIEINSRIITAKRKQFQIQDKILKQEIDNTLAQIYKIQAINSDLKENIQLLIEEAYLFKINERFNESIKTLENAKKLNSNNPVILAELGYIKGIFLHDNNDGSDLIRTAIKLDPDEPRSHYYLGELTEKTNLDPEAIRSYYQAAKLATGQDTWSKGIRKSALDKLLKIFYQYGNGKKDFSKEVSTELKIPLIECATILELYIANNYPKHRDIDEDPYVYLALIYYELKDYKNAIRVIKAGLPEEKRNWRHWGQLLNPYAKTLEKSGSDPNALAEVQSILYKGVSFTSKSFTAPYYDDFFIIDFLK